MKHLELTPDSSILVISSAGDNALHYAIGAGPRRIHCVDMNPWWVIHLLSHIEIGS
jgi:betaine lipid synthase